MISILSDISDKSSINEYELVSIVPTNNELIFFVKIRMSEKETALERVQYKNIVNSGKDAKLGLFSVTGAIIVLASIGCEIGKQVSNYSINYYNGGKYPLPQTLLVVVLEILKLSATFLRLKCKTPLCDKTSIKASFKFLLPSVIYAVNNNIYLGKNFTFFSSIIQWW